MTDITELAQSLKRRAASANEFGEGLFFIKADDVLALVEALEKAQLVDEELCKLLPPGVEYMDPPDGGDVTPLEGVRRMVADYRQRIAELESRTVTVKLPTTRLWAGVTECYEKSDVIAAIRSAGMEVSDD
ncbi:TPA: hypothetical protein ACRR48_001478 [Klebsiella quasipneumoniae]